jgi:hypothetical protein
MQLTIGSLGLPQSGDEHSEWSELHQALLQAVAVITPKELCWRLKITPQYLSDAFAERDRKGVKASWIPVIIALAPDPARAAILRALAAPVGYDVQRRRELTPEEKLARVQERIAQRFGQAGLEFLAEEIGP